VTGGCFWKKDVEKGRLLMLPRLAKWKARPTYGAWILAKRQAANDPIFRVCFGNLTKGELVVPGGIE